MPLFPTNTPPGTPTPEPSHEKALRLAARRFAEVEAGDDWEYVSIVVKRRDVESAPAIVVVEPDQCPGPLPSRN